MWVQTDLSEKPSVAAAAMRNNPNARFSDEPICVAVAASETSPTAGMPNDPVHSRAGGESHPRLVVVGNADWISNLGLVSGTGRDAAMKYGLFTSCLSWLAESRTWAPLRSTWTRSRCVRDSHSVCRITPSLICGFYRWDT